MFSHQKYTVTAMAKAAAVPLALTCEAEMRVGEHLIEQAREILARGNAADGAGEDVVEHQGGNGKFRERAAHGFLHDAIDAAANEHAAAFDVDLGDGVGKQHGGENEPRGGLADELLGFTAGVIGGGGEIVQDDRGRAPVGNEGEHGRGGHKDLGGGTAGNRKRSFLGLGCHRLKI